MPPAACWLFFNDPAPTEIDTLSLHNALPIPAATAAVKFTVQDRTAVPLPAKGKALGVQVALATFAPVGTPVMLMPAGTRSLMVKLLAGPKALAALDTENA